MGEPGTVGSSPLGDYFQHHTEGPGIWKWEHYFQIYERHFAKFVGRPVNILEIGIYAGGSLPMWRQYFGAQCHVYGIDIEPACKAYATEYITVSIGDQADRKFWQSLNLPPIDIVIDDGGHQPEQMIVTLEETLPMMSPEGVYLCEDIHGSDNEFLAYTYGLIQRLNAARFVEGDAALNVQSVGLQRAVHGIHAYPFCVVIERGGYENLKAPRRGSEWQPF